MMAEIGVEVDESDLVDCPAWQAFANEIHVKLKKLHASRKTDKKGWGKKVHDFRVWSRDAGAAARAKCAEKRVTMKGPDVMIMTSDEKMKHKVN